MNYIANLNLLGPATLARRMDVKAAHPIGTFQHIDSGLGFDCVRAVDLSTYPCATVLSIDDEGPTPSCYLLTSTEGYNLSLQRVFFFPPKATVEYAKQQSRETCSPEYRNLAPSALLIMGRSPFFLWTLIVRKASHDPPPTVAATATAFCTFGALPMARYCG